MIGPREADVSLEPYVNVSIMSENPLRLPLDGFGNQFILGIRVGDIGIVERFFISFILVKQLFRVGYTSLLSVRFSSCSQGFH